MKKLITAALTLAFAFALTTGAVAEEKKAKKKGAKTAKVMSRTGELICAHCELGEGASCANALRVTRKGKDGKEVQQIIQLSGDAADALGKGKGQKVLAKGTIKREGKGKDAKLIMTVASLTAAKAKKKK
jgi:hypothetical protein